MKKYTLFIIIFLLTKHMYSQYYVNGQDPFSVKWLYIESKHFKVIFPSDAKLTGEKFTTYLNTIYNTGGKTLGFNPRKTTVIIHPQNTLSNGEVAWAPKRMNLYPIPPQQGDAESYAKQLAIHEFRHVVQIDKLNNSSTRLLYYLFGEQAIGAVLGWHIPLWFFEGDAVAYETGAGNFGRGRQPDFSVKLSAQTDKYGIFSYPKAQLGSYKHFVPNHYELGYQLATRARIVYGDSIWNKTLSQVDKSPVSINAFSKGIKKFTGLPERSLYKKLISQISNNTSQKNTCEKQTYTNYYSPYLQNGSIIAYKTDFDHIAKFISIDNKGKEHTLFTPGYLIDKTFSFADSILVWNELLTTRWENRNYNLLIKYNLKNHKRTVLVKKRRVFASRISPNGKLIASVEINNSLQPQITIRKTSDGSILTMFSFSDSVQISQPSWSDNSKTICFMQVTDSGKSLGILSLDSQEIKWIFKNKYIIFDSPRFSGNTIIATGVFHGVNNILSYSLNDNTWHSLTNERYGTGEANIQNDTIIYNYYTPDGYKIKTTSLNNRLQKIEFAEIYETTLTNYLKNHETQIQVNLNDTNNYKIKKYSRFLNLFNIHSWAPLGIELNNGYIGPGVTIMSQNVLSTSVFSGGYRYNITENSNKLFAEYSYYGFYPKLTFNASKTGYAQYIFDSQGISHYLEWSETDFSAKVSVPININKGKWNRGITPYAEYTSRYISPSDKYKDSISFNYPSIHIMNYSIFAYNLLSIAYRNLQPRWGQKILLNYTYNPFNNNNTVSLSSTELWLYFPGIFANHGVRIYSAYQQKTNDEYSYSDAITYPYGYTSINNDEIVSAHIYYTMPLIYPDLNIFEALYIKRLKAEYFYQYADFTYKNTFTTVSSAGADIKADVHIKRFSIPFEFGVRYARRINMSDNYFNFLFSMKF